MERVLAVLEGLPGVVAAARDAEPKTVRIRYDDARLSVADVVKTVDRADVRLQAHHRFVDWFKLRRRQQNTARILSDRAV